MTTEAYRQGLAAGIPIDQIEDQIVEDEAFAQVVRDQIVFGLGITRDGKRVDPKEFHSNQVVDQNKGAVIDKAQDHIAGAGRMALTDGEK